MRFVFLSVDILPPPQLSKSIFPTSIPSGGTAAYSFTINNTASGSTNQTGIAFTDNLPSGLKIATPPNVVITGGTGTVTATSGGNDLAVSNFSIAAGAIATITLDVTNVPGQYNTDCSSNPAAFTNSAANITGMTNLETNMGNVCLLVACSSNAGTLIRN